MDKDTEAILNKYKEKLRGKVDFDDYEEGRVTSKEYKTFKEEIYSKQLTRYEKLCSKAEHIIKIKPKDRNRVVLEKSIELAHLNVTPEGAASFAVLIGLLVMFLGLVFIGLLYVLTGELKLFSLLFLIIIGSVIIKPLTNLPNYIAARWRLKASNQMVLCILYIVMYMRHTSNLEHALKFSTDHISEPLSLDLRKVFWDVETGKFATIKESLENYLDGWREYNLEFVEAFHLVESSLYEPTESRRIDLLEKSLDVMLNGTYEKMLHYTHDLKNPITMLHMLGIVLPILGLVIFPLVSSFLGGIVKWWHLALLYNILLPIIVLFFGLNVLSKRPTGYGESEVLRDISEREEKKGIFFTSIVIFLLLFFIGLIPLVLHVVDSDFDADFGYFGKLLDYKENNGPYSLIAMFFSFLVPLAVALSVAHYYKTKTKKLIEIREETKRLETEFSGALFQLGNRVGDGIPVEVAVGNVANTLSGTPTGNFFSKISVNISKLGMSLKEAIFNEKNGAILNSPSALIESSMRVLIEGARKGPQVVAKSLISISKYVDNIHTVSERVKDLLADIISSMKSQISFLAPIIAGIVVGLASMIVSIIARLGEQFKEVAVGETGGFNVAGMVEIFKVEDIIPGYYFQIVVGLYVVEVIIILTILANGIENGSDKINEKYMIGKNLYKGALLYIGVAVIVTLLFNLLVKGILSGISGI